MVDLILHKITDLLKIIPWLPTDLSKSEPIILLAQHLYFFQEHYGSPSRNSPTVTTCNRWYPSHSWHLTQAGQIGAFFWDFSRVEEAARCQNPKACQHPWFLPSREGCQLPKSVIKNGGSWHFEFLVQPTSLHFCFNSGLDSLSQ